MAQIILDFGSGATCGNEHKYVEHMIDELRRVDTGRHEVIIKWQLFKDAPPNTPLGTGIFEHAYNYAAYGVGRKYQTTASVFDADSLQFLLTYDIPFVKIANRPDLYWLAGEVPRKIPIYISVGNMDVCPDWADAELLCVSSYPATVNDYEKSMHGDGWHVVTTSLSDHTTDFTLYHKYKPEIYEVHYKLPDSTGPDAGEFARTPKQLSEIL
jgi:hypothetical protein